MTPSFAEHPQMTVEEFEQIARTAPETVTLEFIQGKLEVKPVPDGDHDEIVMWVLRHCMQQRPELALYPERGLAVEKYRSGRARPDGVLAPVGTFAGTGEWADPTGVLMVLEVTSHDGDTDRRDRNEKRDGYAAAGIPVYLLIDRDTCAVTVHSDPGTGAYHRSASFPYGTTVKIPAPVGITLNTESLKDFVR
ncbi:Uma2 family endonuclease [Streptomyces sp. 3211.6]|uniref:Uma2 family endonuclease n=1 Tax=Streptomyces TaxID=1883 RepID=UPI0009A53A10|nr:MULTISPECIES: Uma2 family endonuclease [Streptomyces]RKT06052.1 Uma2 family endonuclease [Streptomyces sp. 3211.6]RPF46407.1 Uma2 family endonuclease [Streptomyces sp. Ag109_G2-6]